MEEILRNDYTSHQQYLRCEGTCRKWFVLWTGVSGIERKEWFYYKSNAKRHYKDVTKVGFIASTNAS